MFEVAIPVGDPQNGKEFGRFRWHEWLKEYAHEAQRLCTIVYDNMYFVVPVLG